MWCAVSHRQAVPDCGEKFNSNKICKPEYGKCATSCKQLGISGAVLHVGTALHLNSEMAHI